MNGKSYVLEAKKRLDVAIQKRKDGKPVSRSEIFTILGLLAAGEADHEKWKRVADQAMALFGDKEEL